MSEQRTIEQKKNQLQEEAQDFYQSLEGGWPKGLESQALGTVGEGLRESLVARVFRELSPSLWAVGQKLVVVHLFASALSLSVCEQFGVRLFFEGHGLMGLFMHLGVIGCFICCGAFYLGSTLVLSKVLFSRPEWRKLRQHFVPIFLALTLSSLAVFWAVQGQIEFVIASAWLVGAMAVILLAEGFLRFRTALAL